MNRQQRRKMQRLAAKDSKANYKRMMRTQMLINAAESLTARELEIAMMGAHPVMHFVETKLDENGVPVDGETKKVKLSKIDIRRLEPVLEEKRQKEVEYLESQGKKE